MSMSKLNKIPNIPTRLFH